MAISVDSIDEFALIERLLAQVSSAPGATRLAGDDCAVVPFGSETLLITCDALVEGRHFRITHGHPRSLGWKAVAVAASDIAAMGGEALWALINLQLPGETPVEFVEEIYRGVDDFLAASSLRLLGGNTTKAGEVSISVTVLGRAISDPVVRSGAAAGNLIFVSGEIGGAGRGLSSLDRCEPGAESWVERYLRPTPRLALGRELAGIATSMIDVSDGLLQDAQHISRASGAGLEIDLALVPAVSAEPSERVGDLCAGGDYELLFTARDEAPVQAAAKRANVRVTRIGQVTASHRVQLLTPEPLTLAEVVDRYSLQGLGYRHFG